MIIHDLREHVHRKKLQEEGAKRAEYQEALAAAVLSTVQRLQEAHDIHRDNGKAKQADLEQAALMTIFALTEEIPWLGTKGVATDALARVCDLVDHRVETGLEQAGQIAKESEKPAE